MAKLNKPLIVLIALIAASASAGVFQGISLRDSTIPAPAGGGGDSSSAIVSADGRYVVFASTAENLVITGGAAAVSGLQPRRMNVFLRDRINSNTTLVSVNASELTGGNGDSWPVAISTNGQFVLFESSASDLVSGDNNGATDVFVRDFNAGTTTLVSVSTGGGSGNGASRTAAMSPDGRFVAFVSAGNNLVADDTNGIADVFVRDLQSATTVLVSVGATGGALMGSDSPEITPDGRYVAFFSTATNLVPGVETSGEVYVRDLDTATTTWASTNALSIFQSVFGSTSVVSCNHQISDDGRFVAFEACTNLPSGLSAKGIILRHDLQSGLTDIVHTNANVAQTPFSQLRTLDMTPDGRFIAFVGNTNVPAAAMCIYRWDAQSGDITLISQDLAGTVMTNAICDWPRMDASGRYVTFLCNATNLTTNALAGEFHLYVRDTQTGDARLLDVDANGIGAGVNAAVIPAFSDDARYFAFDSSDGNLVANDRNRASDVFVRDVVADSTELISAHHPGLPALVANGFSGMSSFSVSTNGRFVAFSSDATDLVPNDTNAFPDVFVRDLQTGSNILVSVALGGGAANGMSYDPSISGDGGYVAFTSWATNLITGDNNNATDVFVRDVQAGTTSLISVSTNGVSVGDGDSVSTQISHDGRYVLFVSRAKNLAPGSLVGPLLYQFVLMHDRLAGTNLPIEPSPLTAYVPTATPDCRFVTCVSNNISLGMTILRVWSAETKSMVFSTTDVSPSYSARLSADAHLIAYVTGGGLLKITNRITGVGWSISQLLFFAPGGSPTLKNPSDFSSDSRLLAYYTTATNSVSDTNSAYDVYLYNTENSSNRLVSLSYSSPFAARGASDTPAISPDGRFVAYRTAASNVVPNDTNDVPDIVLYDCLNNATILISLSQSQDRVARNRSSAPVFSADGKTLLFQSWASDLTAGDFNNGSDLFAIRLDSGPVTDTDGDGMDDQWEMDYLRTLDFTGTNDFDLDGAVDLHEFQAGTNPTNAASLFQAEIGSPLSSGQSSSLSWPASPWKTYRVQFKNDLSDTNWQDLPGNVTLFGNSGIASDFSPDADRRFYRIFLNPQPD